MGLVDYSDSESDSEVTAKPAPVAQKQETAAGGNRKTFQKVVDRSKPGKILVNLPGSATSTQDDSNTATSADEPPAKRARTSKGGAFGGFNSFLPPPKNANKKPTTSIASSSNNSGAKGSSALRPGIHLKTGATPGFSRNRDEDGDEDINGDDSAGSRGMSLPAPKAQQPTIPSEQKPADEVELVGKPLMFRPLSVTRKKPTKKTATKSMASTSNTPKSSTIPPSSASTAPTVQTVAADAEPPPPTKKQKISLFSISSEPASEPEPRTQTSGAYEPLINTEDASTTSAFAAYDAQYGSSSFSPSSSSYAAPSQQQQQPTTAFGTSSSLDGIVSDMNLSAAARRELFGRRGVDAAAAAAKVISFDTEREYEHNEVLRASGEQQQQQHNPLRAIAPGRHNLRQIVSQVHSQRDALEESFAKGRAKQNEAGTRYGWR